MSSLSYKGSLDFSHNLVLEGLGKVKELANAKEIILAEALQTFYNRIRPQAIHSFAAIRNDSGD